MKKSKTCSYVNGEVTDSKSCISFNAGVCKKLEFYNESKTPNIISNCKVKNPRRGNNLEVLVTKNMELAKSGDLKTSPGAVTKGMGKHYFAQCTEI